MGDFNSTSYPTARTEHRCDECSRTISCGERYSRTAAVYWNEFFTNVACLHCAVARFIVDAWSDAYSEDFYGGLSWHLDDADEVWQYRIAIGVRRQWRRFDGDGLMDLPGNPWPETQYPAKQIARAVGQRATA